MAKNFGIILFIFFNLFLGARFEEPAEIFKYIGLALSISLIINGLRNEIVAMILERNKERLDGSDDEY